MSRVIPAFSQYFDGDGEILSGGKLKFTVSGTNLTDKDTYSDIDETVANANPVILDSEGRVPDIFGTDSYRATLYDSSDVQIDQFDPVPGGVSATSAFSTWASSVTYTFKALVLASDGLYYRSLQATNTAHNPASGASPTWWEVVDFIYTFTTERIYVAGEVMRWTDDQVYVCVTTTTAGDTPVSAAAKWDLTITDFDDITADGVTLTDATITESAISGIIATDIGETINAVGTISGASTGIDWEDGNYITCTIAADTTFTFTNWPTGVSGGGLIEITNGGSQSVTFTNSEWIGGTPATLTTSGKDLLSIVSSDQGTSLMVIPIALDIS